MASKNYCVNKHFQFTPEQAKTLTEKAKKAGNTSLRAISKARL